MAKAVDHDREGSNYKPIVIGDDTEMTSSPEMADFSVSEKVLLAPHKHSKHYSSTSTSTPVAHATSSSDKGSRKRARPRGGRRSDLQEEVRMLLEEEMDAMMDVDDDDDGTCTVSDPTNEYQDNDGYDRVDERMSTVSPSPAAVCASKMLASTSRSPSYHFQAKQAQPAASLSQRDTQRLPVQRMEGKKRTCCSASAVSRSPSFRGVWGEVV